MGNNDKTRDENAATDASRDQESRDVTLARTIAVAVAGALAQQKAEETQSIAEAIALQTQVHRFLLPLRLLPAQKVLE